MPIIKEPRIGLPEISTQSLMTNHYATIYKEWESE